MYFSRRPEVIDSASHGNFANGPFRWFPRFGESWSYRSALRQRAYGGEMKVLYSDVYIIVVHRNSPLPFFALPSLNISSTFSHSSHLSFSASSPLLSSGLLSQASVFLFYSSSISTIRFSLTCFRRTVNFPLILKWSVVLLFEFMIIRIDYFILVSLPFSEFSLFSYGYLLLYYSFYYYFKKYILFLYRYILYIFFTYILSTVCHLNIIYKF